MANYQYRHIFSLPEFGIGAGVADLDTGCKVAMLFSKSFFKAHENMLRPAFEAGKLGRRQRQEGVEGVGKTTEYADSMIEADFTMRLMRSDNATLLVEFKVQDYWKHPQDLPTGVDGTYSNSIIPKEISCDTPALKRLVP